MTWATFPRAGTHPKHLRSRRLTTPSSQLGRAPAVATWLVAGAAVAGLVATAIGGSVNLLAEFVNLPDNGLTK